MQYGIPQQQDKGDCAIMTNFYNHITSYAPPPPEPPAAPLNLLTFLDARRRALIIELGAIEDMLIGAGTLKARSIPPKERRG